MKTKLYCRRCGEQLLGDGGYCHCCQENKGDADIDDRYFPDDPKNKVYTVDAYVTLCKCFRVEAKDGDEAKRIVRDQICNELEGCTGRETAEVLGCMGFEDAEDQELRVSGETDENGEIGYY